MESANLSHQRQHPDLWGGSSSIARPSLHGVHSSHLWNQNLVQNDGNFIWAANEAILGTSRGLTQHPEIIIPPSVNTSMFLDFTSRWPSDTANFSNLSNHLRKLQEEDDPESLSKCSHHLEELPLPSTSYINREQQFLQDLNDKSLLRNLPSDFQPSDLRLQFSGDQVYHAKKGCTSLSSVAAWARGSFSKIYPSATISSPYTSSSSHLSSLGMSMEAMDLFCSAKVGGSTFTSAISNMVSREHRPLLGSDILQEGTQETSNCSSHKASFLHGAAHTERTKASPAPAKKPRLESGSSLAPFKVRKEKLGDRVAALQQLVAPFGKTDTASVLMEATGYIKFLQDQVQNLSVSYMKSSGKTNRGTRQESGSGGEEGEKEPKRDLRSRGLCLVPLSCTSYVTNNDSRTVWSPPNFTGSSSSSS